MKHVQVRSLLLVSIMLILSFVSMSASAEAQSSSQFAEASEQVTFIDPQFDFTVKYPASWQAVSRGNHAGVAGTVSFVSNDTASRMHVDLHDAPTKVEIGMYLVPWSDRTSLPDRTLKGWMKYYNQLSEVPGVETVVEEPRYMRVNGRRALYEAGYGFSPYRYVSIPRGDIVWFIWSNARSETEIALFDQIVRSFKFGKSTPATLQEALGSDFHPSHLVERLDSTADNQGDLPSDRDDRVPLAPSVSNSWKSPLRGTNLSATCNSTAHGPHYGGTNQGKSEYAIDLPGVEWVTPVYASRQGTIRFAGWNTNGFGNLVKLERDGLTAFTAHLAGIKEDIYTGKYVNTGTHLGWVGKTGNVTGTHLHFEIRDITPHSVSLIGLGGFTVGSGAVYPYPGAPNTGLCGTITY